MIDMHIPDGFLDTKTVIASGAIAAVGIGLALRSVRRSVPERRLPLIGLASAFVFAAQMLNFPVAGGTSGHLIGAVLAAVLLGPSASVLVMTTVLILQSFMFADGGVTALGANIFNMAIVAPIFGYALYRLISRLMGNDLRARLTGTAFAAWGSTVAAAICCAGQLALSHTVPWRVVFPAMAGIHMLIGIGEAVITTLVVAVIARARPDLFLEGEGSFNQFGYREFIGYGILASIGLAIFVAPFACGWPDGLEMVAHRLGFEQKAAEAPVLLSPLPDYTVPGLGSAMVSTIIAGVIGTAVAFLLAYLFARFLTPKSISVNDRTTGGRHDRA